MTLPSGLTPADTARELHARYYRRQCEHEQQQVANILRARAVSAPRPDPDRPRVVRVIVTRAGLCEDITWSGSP